MCGVLACSVLFVSSDHAGLCSMTMLLFVLAVDGSAKFVYSSSVGHRKNYDCRE